MAMISRRCKHGVFVCLVCQFTLKSSQVSEELCLAQLIASVESRFDCEHLLSYITVWKQKHRCRGQVMSIASS